MFGKTMSIPDNLMESYFELLTSSDPEQMKQIREKIKTDPRNAKIELAKKIVAPYHGEAAAKKEAEGFDRVFSKKENPDNPDELKITDKEIWIVDLLKKAGAVSSTSDAKRLIEQGAVSIDGQKITDFNTKLLVTKGSLLKAGKKKFIKIV